MTKKQDLRAEIEALLSEIKDLLNNAKWDITDTGHASKWKEMVAKAVELHKIVQPAHHQYMIKNRGVSPDDPEFYNHIHPIEDLLAFMDDPHANDDPEDITIDHEFTISVLRDPHEFLSNIIDLIRKLRHLIDDRSKILIPNLVTFIIDDLHRKINV